MIGEIGLVLILVLLFTRIAKQHVPPTILPMSSWFIGVVLGGGILYLIDLSTGSAIILDCVLDGLAGSFAANAVYDQSRAVIKRMNLYPHEGGNR